MVVPVIMKKRCCPQTSRRLAEKLRTLEAAADRGEQPDIICQ